VFLGGCVLGRGALHQTTEVVAFVIPEDSMNHCTCGGMTDGSHAVNCPFAKSVTTVIGPSVPVSDSVPTGWQCPGCKRYNSPSVLVCSCAAPDTTKRTLLG